MSIHEGQLASCEGKHKFTSKARAKEVAKAQRRAGHGRIHEYRCQYCGAWHVGAAKPKQISTWEPREDQDRPTLERRKRGDWVFIDTEIAGRRVAKDMASTPIDRLENSGALSNEQASAAREFESLYLRAQETPQARDSTTIWEPQGHDSGDGPVEAARDRKELYLFLGMQRDKLLRWICVDHNEPKLSEVGLLREALNEAVRFFK
ncbi:hypothetical protein Q5Y75_05715 [Ruegeria sp. 2205SS24-7]|uniref:hypothetical protein n=1 Tax=Ruegeria discodermiae TaxID=3064389 RepID=UPI002741DD83|nr:hypothetical protein [Ruegeria sp. 2205SS24-7]MDP5216708.1 hypothetical protein [Ruegeria sp. 2205SS24-7]